LAINATEQVPMANETEHMEGILVNGDEKVEEEGELDSQNDPEEPPQRGS